MSDGIIHNALHANAGNGVVHYRRKHIKGKIHPHDIKLTYHEMEHIQHYG